MTPDPSGAARAPQPLAELLAEVRGALQQATPGPWGMFDGWGPHTDGAHRAAYIGQTGENRLPVVWSGVQPPMAGNDLVARREDFEFIAQAHRWLGALVQAVEDQRRTIETLEGLRAGLERSYVAARDRVAQLRADGQRLRQSLDDAAITMRNYYRGAISRAAVDENIVLIRAALAWWDAH